MRILICAGLVLLVSVLPARAEEQCELRDLAINAALDDVEAQFYLGTAFYRGTEIPHDRTKSAQLWRQVIAAGGLPSSDPARRYAAHSTLGYLLFYGVGVPAEKEEAIGLWREAAKNGHPEALLFLGNIYLDGDSVGADPVRAYAYFAAAVQAGRGDAPSEPIVSDAQAKLDRLTASLSARQIAQAKKMSGTIVRPD